MEPAAFVTARLDDDEAAANAAIAHVDGEQHGSGWTTAGGYDHNAAADPVRAFIRGWSPERVLAECSAKRRLLEAGVDARELARPWATHADFDPSWLDAGR